MEDNEQQLNNSAKKKRISKFIDVLLWVMIAVLVVAVLVRTFVFTQITVSGVSMTSSYYDAEISEHYNPKLTFHDAEVVHVSKLSKPKRGDVVVFYKNPVNNKFFAMFVRQNQEGGKYEKLIKRVVALSGDKLWVEQVEGSTNRYRVVVETPDGVQLYENYYKRNGTVLDEEAFFLTDTISTSESGLGVLANHVGKDNALVISENCFFAMGDNRINSLDSRAHGERGEFPLDQLFGVVVNA